MERKYLISSWKRLSSWKPPKFSVCCLRRGELKSLRPPVTVIEQIVFFVFLPSQCLQVETAHFIWEFSRHPLLEARKQLRMKGPRRVVAQHAGLCSAAEGQQEQGVCPNHLVGLHCGQRPRGFHLQGLFP